MASTTPTRRVLLASMPFAPLYAPSLGLSLLQGQLRRGGVDAVTRYFGFDFARTLGEDLYCLLTEGFPTTISLSGEWLFSHCLFRRKRDDFEEYTESVIRREYLAHSQTEPLNTFLDGLRHARSLAPAFVENAAQEIAATECSIVGFTSVFQQHIASLAVARRLKEVRPGIRIVFGGANCEGEMGRENLQQFDFLDVVVSGEGERAFAQIVGDYHSGRSTSRNQPGVYQRTVAPDLVTFGTPAPAAGGMAMDDLPWPDYGEYMEQATQAGIRMDRIRLLFESSRGCWWGEKHHCTFCGLNGSTMKFRSKSPDRCLEELRWLYERFGVPRFSAADNILDPRYLETFVPALAAAGLPLELFYEVKANLKKHHLRLLRDAGVTSLQPGIESLSSQVLTLMRKGVTALQNIQTLKWCKEFGIEVAWNLLWGFPGEHLAAYEEIARLLPLCEHLPPPLGIRKIRMDRFSPNYEESDLFGFSRVRAAAAYGYIYPFARESLNRLAYYFDADAPTEAGVESLVDRIQAAVEQWATAQESSDLIAVDNNNGLIIIDLRSISSRRMRVFHGLEREILLFCDEVHSRDVIYKTMTERLAGTSSDEVDRAVERLSAAGLLVAEGHNLLGLSILLGQYSPGVKVLEKLLELESDGLGVQKALADV